MKSKEQDVRKPSRTYWFRPKNGRTDQIRPYNHDVINITIKKRDNYNWEWKDFENLLNIEHVCVSNTLNGSLMTKSRSILINTIVDILTKPDKEPQKP